MRGNRRCAEMGVAGDMSSTAVAIGSTATAGVVGPACLWPTEGIGEELLLMMVWIMLLLLLLVLLLAVVGLLAVCVMT